jgi:uncharacterized protein YbjT (DUF2867 family)
MDARTSTGSTSPILVTGGTGTLGRLVVPRLRAAGCNVRVLTRRHVEDADGIEHVKGDLETGEGIDAAVDGAAVIVHLAGSAKGDEAKTRHLVGAARSAGARHLVYISVVGANRIPMGGAIDRAMFGYFGEKHGAEQAVAESWIPWSMVRATQFQELTFKTVAAMAKMPVVPVPSGFRFQPIAAGEVADTIVELGLGAPAGLVPELGGPRVYEMAELVRGYLRATDKRRPIISMRLPGNAARAFREGANLTPDRAVGVGTWEEFLAAHVGSHRQQTIEVA